MTLKQAADLARRESAGIQEPLFVYRDPDSEEPEERAFEYGSSGWLECTQMPDGVIVAVYARGERLDLED